MYIIHTGSRENCELNHGIVEGFFMITSKEWKKLKANIEEHQKFLDRDAEFEKTNGGHGCILYINLWTIYKSFQITTRKKDVFGMFKTSTDKFFKEVIENIKIKKKTPLNMLSLSDRELYEESEEESDFSVNENPSTEIQNIIISNLFAHQELFVKPLSKNDIWNLLNDVNGFYNEIIRELKHYSISHFYSFDDHEKCPDDAMKGYKKLSEKKFETFISENVNNIQKIILELNECVQENENVLEEPSIMKELLHMHSLYFSMEKLMKK